jgi:2-amino-4-hydroxy-6-hydroxymethyldihydropteridine diphosphokinase
VTQTHTAYIGFGSNLGDLMQNLKNVQEKLSGVQGIRVLRTSKLYRSEPHTLNPQKQPWYLNAVIEIETTHSPQSLFVELKNIEQSMGRKKVGKWQPRVVDLDILFFGNLIYQDSELKIPHQEIPNRKFVLAPLCDLVPHFKHPELEFTTQEILKHTSDTLTVTLCESQHKVGS